MSCSCCSTMDIRGRCCPFTDNKAFKKCPARLDTAFFHFENDCEIHNELLADDFNNYESVIKKFLKKIKLTAERDTRIFIEMFVESKEEEWEGDTDKYFKAKTFNKFRFRPGRIIQGLFINNSDLSSYCIVKSTKAYIEAYPVYSHGVCGDVRKFTRPNMFIQFKLKKKQPVFGTNKCLYCKAFVEKDKLVYTNGEWTNDWCDEICEHMMRHYPGSSSKIERILI